MRKTSIEAYTSIVKNGRLSKRRLQVYMALYKYGPCTANELYRHMQAESTEDLANANIVTRLGELRDREVVDELSERVCSVTNQTVIVWDTNDAFEPVEPEKPMTAQQKIDFLKATARNAAEELRKNGFVEDAVQIENNIALIERGA